MDFFCAAGWDLTTPAWAIIVSLNSINPFRVEGQKSIVIEMMDPRDWRVPDWIVLPGGNLGNTSAFGKALRELHPSASSTNSPRLAAIQAAGSSV